jgi:hypothetical protein
MGAIIQTSKARRQTKMARKTYKLPDTLGYWAAEYKRWGVDLGTFLDDCHEDNVPHSDEFITAVWNSI